MTGDFFDREEEVYKIGQFCKNFSPENRSVLWIEGEPGVGKSILMEKVLSGIIEKDLLFEYEDGRKYHKCNEGDESVDFSMLSPFLSTLEQRCNIDFGAIVSEYVRNFSAISLREALLLSIPGIKGFGWMAPLFKLEQNQKIQFQKNISDFIIKSHLVSLFVNLITAILPKLYSSYLVVLAIDDISWIDFLSFRVLIASAEKLRKSGISLSFVVTTRDYASINNKEHFKAVERGMTSFADNGMCYPLQLDNLGIEKTRKYFHFSGKPEFENRLDFIFRETHGNFLRLFQTMKCSTERLERLYTKSLSEKAVKNQGDRDLFSQEHIKTVFKRTERANIILSIITAFRNSVTESELKCIVIGVCKKLYDEFLSVDSINTCINELRNDGLVSKAGDYIFCHDRILDQVRSIEIQMGEQKKIWSAILASIMTPEKTNIHFPFPRNLVIGIDIASQISKKRALKFYFKHLPKFSSSPGIPNDYLRLGAESLCALCHTIDVYTLNTVAVEALRLLVLASLYRDAIELGDQVYKRYDELTENRRFPFLFSFLTSIRECDAIVRTDNVSAQEIADKLFNLSNLRPYQKAKALLLYCSILEYLGRFDEIVKIYNDLRGIINSIKKLDDRRHAKAVFCRNAGLAYFHGDIVGTYEEGVELAKGLAERPEHEKIVLIGTSYNNLGLGYLYNRRLDSAIDAFEKSCRYLELVQYGTECPSNNLALSYFLKKDFEKAYEYIKKARQCPPGKYQKLGIEANYSVILWKMGLKKEALEIVAPIAKGEDLNHAVTAIVIRAHAAMSYAYFLMENNDFWKAAEYYQKSILDRFRIQNDIERNRRKLLVNYCLAKAGATVGQDIGDISILDDSDEEFFNRPYDFVTLALYVN